MRAATLARALTATFGAATSALAAMLAAGVLAGAGATTACGTAAAGGGTGDQDPAGGPILVGASVPLTGALSGNARAMQGGALAAVAQINALGGILGRQVTVNTQDDMSSPSGARSVATNLQSLGVPVLFGPNGSAEVSTILPFLTTQGLLDLSATATAANLTQNIGPQQGVFFRTVPSDAYQAIAVALFAASGPPSGSPGGKCRTMSVVHNTDDYGTPLAMAIEQYFTAHGGTVPEKGGDIGVQTNALGSYTPQVNLVLKTLPDCMVLAVYPPTAAQFMHNLSDALASSTPTGWSQSFFVIGTDGTYDPSLLTDGMANPADPSSRSWVDGTYGPPMYGTVALTNDQNRPEYNELATIYQAEVGLQPGMTDLDPYTSNEYDAVVLALLAIESAGTTKDAKAIQTALFNVSRGKHCGATTYGPADLPAALDAVRKGQDINYQGASGDVDFSDYGDVVGNFLVWQVTTSGFADVSEITTTQLASADKQDAGGCQ